MSANSRLALVLIGVVVLISAITILRPSTLFKPVDHGLARVTINGTTVYVTLADTPATREHGLSGRSFLAPDEGMLFVFEEDGRHSFWMKDMLISIDMIWINADKRIIKIVENASPESYPNIFEPDEPARYVLEVQAGYAKLHGLHVGDRVEI